jgi:hypothetical protein
MHPRVYVPGTRTFDPGTDGEVDGTVQQCPVMSSLGGVIGDVVFRACSRQGGWCGRHLVWWTDLGGGPRL